MKFSELDYNKNRQGDLEYQCPNCGQRLVGLGILVDSKCFSCGTEFDLIIKEVE